jgi:hypothetical protein
MKTLLLNAGFLILAFGLSLPSAAEPKHGVKPASGFVPDEKTAIAIAVAVWTPIYGEEKIQNEKPYKAILKSGVWQVEGTLPSEYRLGGVAIAEISKDDARVLRVSHGK